jgi:hypothetical protein
MRLPTLPLVTALFALAACGIQMPSGPQYTYTDTTYGFSFDYPTGYALEETQTFSQETAMRTDKNGQVVYEDPITSLRSLHAVGDTTTLPEFIVHVFPLSGFGYGDFPAGVMVKYDKDSDTWSTHGPNGAEELTDRLPTAVTIGGKPAYRAELRDNAGSLDAFLIPLPDKDVMISMAFSYWTGDERQPGISFAAAKAIEDQILGSVTFQ